MSSRSKARKRALDILFGADVRDQPIAAMLDEEAGRAAAQPQRESSWPYAREIVEGVESNLTAIDAAIDRARAGLDARADAGPRPRDRPHSATWEILFNDEVPDGVAIAEAVESATVLSTEDSAGFLNGLLGGIARARRRS